MKKNTINKERIEGRVYDYDLQVKTVQNQTSPNYGKEFISGTVDVATDDEGLNIVTVHFSYVTPTYTKSGKPNATYTALSNLMTNGKRAIVVDMDEATAVRIDASLGLNDYYSDRSGTEELVSTKRNVGSFLNIIRPNELAPVAQRDTFKIDMLINGVQLVEANPERYINEDYLILKGATFDFRQAILPIEVVVKDPKGIQYFQNLNISPAEPVFTCVWGHINMQTVKSRKEEESAFGEAAVVEYSRTIREWVVNGTLMPDAVYPIGDEVMGITKEDIQKAMADRNVYLADVKRRADDYKASKATTIGSQTVPSPEDFNF